MDVKKVLQEECGDFLKRYATIEQKKMIIAYWEVIRFTRKTGSISVNIMKTEMAYWQKFDVDVVMEALKAHINQKQEYRESYTRGIMRNMQEKKNGKKSSLNYSISKSQKARQSIADNFAATPRDLDFLVE